MSTRGSQGLDKYHILLLFLFTTAGNQPEAKRFLEDYDITRRMSTAQSKVLGCMACRWNATETADGKPKTYGYEIKNCSGIKPGVLYPILSRLEEADLLTAEYESSSSYENARRPPRRYLLPADNELGDAFRQTLEMPEVCNLPVPVSE